MVSMDVFVVSKAGRVFLAWNCGGAVCLLYRKLEDSYRNFGEHTLQFHVTQEWKFCIFSRFIIWEFLIIYYFFEFLKI